MSHPARAKAAADAVRSSSRARDGGMGRRGAQTALRNPSTSAVRVSRSGLDSLRSWTAANANHGDPARGD